MFGYSFDITYLPLAAAILAAVASLSGVWVANRFAAKNLQIVHQNQLKAKDREIRLQKLEELYFLFDRWQVFFTNLYLHHLRFHVHRLNYEQLLELIGKLAAPTAENGDFQKIQMLMNIHFKALVIEYKPVETSRKALVPFLQAAPNNAVDISEFKILQKNFENAAKDFKDKIAAIATDVMS